MGLNVAALRREMQVFVDDRLSKDARRAFFQQSVMEIEAETLARWRRQIGAEPSYQRIVDGDIGAPVSEADNIVILRLIPIAVAAQFAWNLLKQYAKVRTDPAGTINGFPPGRYKGAMEIELNGTRIKSINLNSVGAQDVFRLTNLTPYARILEKTGENIQGSIPISRGGLFESVAAATKAEFGNTVDVRYAWELYPGAGPKGPASRRKTKTQRATDDRFPTIIIKAF